MFFKFSRNELFVSFWFFNSENSAWVISTEGVSPGVVSDWFTSIGFVSSFTTFIPLKNSNGTRSRLNSSGDWPSEDLTTGLCPVSNLSRSKTSLSISPCLSSIGFSSFSLIFLTSSNINCKTSLSIPLSNIVRSTSSRVVSFVSTSDTTGDSDTAFSVNSTSLISDSLLELSSCVTSSLFMIGIDDSD